jgi:threonine/homoserine/homoserine lactone efflux protein
MPVSFETLAAFIVTCTLIELTPGPNMAYLAMLSLVQGRRAGFAATVGIALGLLLLGIGAALGLAALISSSRVLYEALRWGGVGYMLWLAREGWLDAEDTKPKPVGAEADATFFTRGLVTNLLNPKAAVFFVAVLPTFVNPAVGVLGQTLMLSVVYVGVATTIHITIVALAGTAKPFLEDPQRVRVTRRVLAVALAAVALWFAYATGK